MLINVAAPRPKIILPDGTVAAAEGMVAGSSSVEPGAPPPWIIPQCAQCRVPVERFTVDYIASPHYLPIQFSCHGRTSGMKVPLNHVLKASSEGGQLWVFTEKTYVRRPAAR